LSENEPIGDSPTDVQALLLLCDSAQSVGGKLYILGGGWTQVAEPPPGNAIPMGLAVRVLVPWDRTNEQIPVHLRLVNDQGVPVSNPDSGEPLEATTALEVGRPPGVARGTPLDAALALNFMGVVLTAGSYVWELEVAGNVKARAPFRVLPSNQQGAA
jgi:hypothetical protein